MIRVLGIAACLALLPAPVLSVPVIGANSFSMTVSGHVLLIPYDGNKSLSSLYTLVEHAVVLVPGSNRSSNFAYETLLEAANIAGANDAATMLIAPQFLIEEDIDFYQLPADRLFWSEGGWKQGNASLSTTANPRPASLSSFAVLDSILYRIASRNPNLQTLVVAGHSAGGQFVQRFAAGSSIEAALESQFGIDVVYVPANPSSYLYLDAERVVSGTLDQFAVPPASVVGACPGYDDYKYGMHSRNSYMSRLTSAQITSRYPQRHVRYLLGELDTDPAAAELDTSCAAMLQGRQRLERGLIYGNYLEHFHGSGIIVTHPTFVVPGVGHDSRGMFTSVCGVAQLFGGGGCVAVDAGEEASRDTGMSSLALQESQPNPFHTRTTILYRVRSGGPSTLCIYDVRGQLVRTLCEGFGQEELGSIVWDGRSNTGQQVPAGVYILRLQQGRERLTRRVTRLR